MQRLVSVKVQETCGHARPHCGRRPAIKVARSSAELWVDEVRSPTRLPRGDSRPTEFVAGSQQARWYERPREYPLGPVEQVSDEPAADEVRSPTRVPRGDSRPTEFVAEGQQARWYESPRESPSARWSESLTSWPNPALVESAGAVEASRRILARLWKQSCAS